AVAGQAYETAGTTPGVDMSEPVRLTITAEDLASPALQQVRQQLDALPMSAEQAARVFSDLGISEETLRQTSTATAQAWGTLTDALIRGGQASTENAAAVRQVENAMATFLARSDMAG